MIEILEMGERFLEHKIDVFSLADIKIKVLIPIIIMLRIFIYSVLPAIKNRRTKSPKESETPIISDRDKDGYLR